MHASTVRTSLGAVLFVGEAGHGKSTLVAALVQQGYAMLADDVTAVSMDNAEEPLALASFPQLRLCVDAAERLGHRTDELARVQSPGRADEKYRLAVSPIHASPLPIHAVYALNVHDEAEVTLEPVNTMERFALVVANTYRPNFLEGLGLRKWHFDTAARLARTVNFVRVTRPRSPYLLDELVERLEGEFGPPLETGAET